MFFVYVIYSEAFNKIYIGFTSNLENRIFAHNNLPKGWTSKFRPWQLVFSEKYETKKEAMIREQQLKSHAGRNFIRQKILNQL